MRIVVVGAGTVGFHLAEQLNDEGHDIVVIDRNAARLRFVAERLAVMSIEGNGASPVILEKAQVEKAEILLAVTDSDELNMIVCLLARDYGVKTRIARVRNPDYTSKPDLTSGKLGIDLVISPEETAVTALERLLLTPGATEIAEFADGEVLLVGFEIARDAPLVGRNLAEIRAGLGGEGFLIVSIARQETIIIPRGEDSIAAGDRIFVLMPKDVLPLFLPMIHRRAYAVEDVVIFGASRVGCRLAARLSEQNITIIEPEEKVCEALATDLPRATVLQGRGTDLELLEDARIDGADAFVAASNDDEENVMAALLARRGGAKLTAVLIEDPEYAPILSSLDVDITVNPQLVTVGAILRYIRSDAGLTVAKFRGQAAEAIEGVVAEEASGAGRPLKEVELPRDSLVGAVVADGKMTIPDGETVIRPGEKVILFALSEAASRAQKFFAKKKK